MSNVIYAALSRQTALERELASIANNIANSSTTGYRKDTQIFSEYVNAVPFEPSISQTRIGARAISAEQGEFIATGASLDVAIEGPGYFVVQTPAGERLTRAGAFLRNGDGLLGNLDGFPVQGEGGGAIALPADATEVVIANDGVISARGEVIGRVRIAITDDAFLQREGSALLKAHGALTDVEPTVRQGFLEASNVSPVLELSRLIEVQRAFEIGQQLLANESERIERAVEIIGGNR